MIDIVKSETSDTPLVERTALQSLLFWIQLGIADFRLQYRKSVIGPLWPGIQALVWAAGLGLIFRSMSQSEPHYLPYVIVGLSTFGLISSCLNSGTVFFGNSALLLSVNNPLYTHVLRQWSTHMCFYLMQMLAYFVGYGFSDIQLGWNVFLFFPAFLILCVTTFWLVFLIGIIVTRYRDVRNAVQVCMRFLFFTSPVFWAPGKGTAREVISAYNPLSYFLTIVREPLLGRAPTAFDWMVTITIAVGGAIVTYIVFRKVEKKLIFWL